jgi:hypothetical protein
MIVGIKDDKHEKLLLQYLWMCTNFSLIVWNHQTMQFYCVNWDQWVKKISLFQFQEKLKPITGKVFTLFWQKHMIS